MCGKLETLWMPYLDGKLTANERAMMEAHFAVCDECARRRDEFAGVSGALGTWEAPPPSPWFDARLMARVRAESEPKSVWVRFTQWVPAAPITLALLLLVGALVISTGGRRQVVVQDTRPPAQPVALTDARMDDVLHAADEVELLNNFELLSELKKPQPQQQGRR